LTAHTSSLSGKCILVVDDDSDMRTLLRRILLRLKVGNVAEAGSAKEALDAIDATDGFDLVVCDWNMPEVSGLDLFKAVHEMRPDLPFLMLTGRADHDSVVSAKKAGVSAYIVKPVSAVELAMKIRFLTGVSA
jgi:two-component system, chemotaxis family, chemotaxis protein CheY